MPDLRSVVTYETAIVALGGTAKAARALGKTQTQICKWRVKHGAFPADLYRKVQRELERRGYVAADRVFTFERAG